LGLFLAILGGRVSFEGGEKAGGNAGDFIDGGLKHAFVGFGRLVETADLSHKLERSGSNLFLGYGRIEVEKSFDVPAHDDFKLSKPLKPVQIGVALASQVQE
jgi:hypothetical protein